MKRFSFRGLLVVIVILFCIPHTSATWSEPVLLSELNDHQNNFPAYGPAISSDGLSIYFARQIPGDVAPFDIFEARRDTPDGVFQPPRRLVELGITSTYVEKPWISLDGLRLYYAEILWNNNQAQRYIRVSSRTSTSDPWNPSVTIKEIHKFFNESVDANPALIGDELTIFWQSNRDVFENRSNYYAVRKSLNDPFIKITEITELNALGASGLHFSSDGLTIYFTAPNPQSGLANIWKGTRSARDGVFGDFEIQLDLGGPDIRCHSPYLTPDGKTIYFFRKTGDDLLTEKGIWVSHWIEDPQQVVMNRLQETIETKEAMIADLEATMAGEREALETLKTMYNQREYGTWTPINIRRAIIQISLGLSRQELSKRLLGMSIDALEKAKEYLQQPTPKPQPVR